MLQCNPQPSERQLLAVIGSEHYATWQPVEETPALGRVLECNDADLWMNETARMQFVFDFAVVATGDGQTIWMLCIVADPESASLTLQKSMLPEDLPAVEHQTDQYDQLELEAHCSYANGDREQGGDGETQKKQPERWLQSQLNAVRHGWRCVSEHGRQYRQAQGHLVCRCP